MTQLFVDGVNYDALIANCQAAKMIDRVGRILDSIRQAVVMLSRLLGDVQAAPALRLGGKPHGGSQPELAPNFFQGNIVARFRAGQIQLGRSFTIDDFPITQFLKRRDGSAPPGPENRVPRIASLPPKSSGSATIQRKFLNAFGACSSMASASHH